MSLIPSNYYIMDAYISYMTTKYLIAKEEGFGNNHSQSLCLGNGAW